MAFGKSFEKLVLKYGSEGITESVIHHYDKLLHADEKTKHKFLYDIFSVDVKIKLDFIELSNSIVEQRLLPKKVSLLMLLLPFCLQDTNCSHRVVWQIDNCKECGECKIGDLKRISSEKHVDIKIAIRSAFAPKIVREANPDLVIALACENESVKGILGIPQFPCYCVSINHPNGYCVNTTVDIASVIKAIDKFSNSKKPVQ